MGQRPGTSAQEHDDRWNGRLGAARSWAVLHDTQLPYATGFVGITLGIGSIRSHVHCFIRVLYSLI
jgi:hypothetical protein